MKLILIGVWACAITLAADYAATSWKASQARMAAAAEQAPPQLEYKKTREFTIPKIAEGEVQGYIIVELSYAVDPLVQKGLSATPEPFLIDETYRYIYEDAATGLKDLKKYDLNKLKQTLIQNINARLDAKLIKDVMIEQFNYMTRMDVKKQL